jgi:small conductance mechanosensitive channel
VWDTIVDFANDFWSENSTAIVSTVLVLIGAFILTAIARHGVKQWERKIDRELGTSEDASERERGQRLATISDVLRVFISIVVIAVVVLTIMGVWGIPMTPLIAIGSTIGIAVGLGAQDVVRDVIAGFLILVEDQYSIGDTVTVAGVSGTVESIKLRTTVLRDLDGKRYICSRLRAKRRLSWCSNYLR